MFNKSSKMKKELLLSIIVCFCISDLFSQVTVTLKPVAGAGKDAAVTTQVPTANYGTIVDIEAITWTCQSVLCNGRSLLEYDLSFIPSGSVINSATLYLYANNNAPNGIPGQPTYGTDNAGYIRRITQSWNENTVTWNNQPATTTLNQVTIPQSTSTSQDYVMNVTTLTQDMIDNPNSGYGFMFSEINEVNYYNSLIFCSSDIPDTSLAPALVITYTAPGGMICFEVQPNAADGKDANITTQVPTANYGTHPDYEGVTWTCQSVLCNGRSLIQFDLSAIPATAHVDSAFLFLYANNNALNGIVGQPTYGNDNAGILKRITQTWDENTVTWNNQPATTPQDQVIIPQSTSTSQDYVLDIINLVQTSIQNPSTSFGFMISEINEVNYYNSLIFGSSDAADVNIHPKLKVCYTPTTAISENSFSTLSVYPNPSRHSFTISDSGHFIDKVEVFNILGEMILIQEGKGNASLISIDASALNIGVYFARIRTDRGTVVRKLVKN